MTLLRSYWNPTNLTILSTPDGTFPEGSCDDQIVATGGPVCAPGGGRRGTGGGGKNSELPRRRGGGGGDPRRAGRERTRRDEPGRPRAGDAPRGGHRERA